MLDRIESRIQSFVQNWIADPLQWSGINLDWQIRVACALIAIGWVFIAYGDAVQRSWVGLALTGLIIPRHLAGAIYGLDGIAKRAIGESRFELVMWTLFLLVDVLVVAIVQRITLREYAWFLVEVSIILRWFLVRCKPKPPAGNLQLAGDSI